MGAKLKWVKVAGHKWEAGEFVIKKLDGFSGRGWFKVRRNDAVIAEGLESLTEAKQWAQDVADEATP